MRIISRVYLLFKKPAEKSERLLFSVDKKLLVVTEFFAQNDLKTQKWQE